MTNLLHQINDTSYMKSTIMGINIRSLGRLVIVNEFLNKKVLLFSSYIIYEGKNTNKLPDRNLLASRTSLANTCSETLVAYLHSPSWYPSIRVTQILQLLSRDIHLLWTLLPPFGACVTQVCILPRTFQPAHVAQKSRKLQPLWVTQRPRTLPPVCQEALIALFCLETQNQSTTLGGICFKLLEQTTKGTRLQPRNRRPEIKIISPNSRQRKSRCQPCYELIFS